jgi:penicillin-binding protein 2
MKSEPSIFFHEVNERQGAFHRRTFLLGGLAGTGILALTGRLAQLQLLDTDRYKTLSASNQFNFRLIPPPRGRILDRNGVELAGNRPNFRLLLSRDAKTDPEAVLQQISEFIPIDDSRRRQVMRDLKNSPRYVPVSLADDLTWEEFTRINVRSPELPGITADMGEARVYPFGGAFAHVIGYVSRVSADDMKREGDNPDPVLLHPGFRIGKQGVEKSLDKQLRGKAGGQKVEVDSRGRVVRKDPRGDITPVPGAEVVLTLDADIQNRALEVFGAESGAAVMMDIRNGDILCMTSAPSFDANQFVKGMDRASYQALATYERKPLLDKALSSTFPPGSTFKTMVALAALANGYDRHTVHVCNRVWNFGGRPWHCDQAHGAQDLRGAIATSCDVYFYQCAMSVGPDKIAAMARKFGLGEEFDLGIPGQKKGLVPDTAYKRRAFPKDPVWHPGETPSMGIGQGYTHLNPLQLCVQVSRIANGQKSLHPRLIKSVGGVDRPHGSDFGDLPVDREHLRFVREAMAAVTGAGDVKVARATAAAVADLGLGPIKMAGKTGTAQAHTYTGGGTGAHGAVGAWALRDHAWFICFAPYDDPRYAMSVLVEHGGWGSGAAAPRAREIMRVALLKDPEIRARIMQQNGGKAPPENSGLPAPDPNGPPDIAADEAPVTPAPDRIPAP